jgi:hypothetical protein
MEGVHEPELVSNDRKLTYYNRSTSIAMWESKPTSEQVPSGDYKAVATGMSCNMGSGNQSTGRRRLLNLQRPWEYHYCPVVATGRGTNSYRRIQSVRGPEQPTGNNVNEPNE